MPLDQLLPFQQQTVDWMVVHPRNMLTSAMGTGKSACAIKTIDKLYENKPPPSVLIVCGLRKAVPTWFREIPKWRPGTPFVLYRGTPFQRKKLVDQVRQPGMWVITTGGMLKEILAIKKTWDVLAIDEAHRFVNRKSEGFKDLKKVVSRHFIWITGTALINGPQDLWTGLHLIDPKKHRSYWRYINEHCYVEHNGYGLEVIGAINSAASKRALSDYLYQISDEVVAAQMPPKRHLGLPVEMTPYQQKAYEELAEEFITVLKTGDNDGNHPESGLPSEALVISSNRLSSDTRLRQLLITPALIGGDNSQSAGLEMIRDKIDEDKKSCVIFTPFRKAFPFIDEWIKPLATTIEHIHGQLTDKQFDDTLRRFQAAKDLKVLVSTIRSAASWEVPEIQTAYFIGYDWTPAYNRQAEDRLHRLISVGPVTCWYVQHLGTIDEHIIDILEAKIRWSQLLIQPRQLLLPAN